MPTGYTADIKDGISFRTFAMNCARAFGACVMLRDEPSGGDQIPEKFEPSDYNAKAVEKAKKERHALALMSEQELQRAANKAFDDEEAARFHRIQEMRATSAKYEAMLKSVDAWRPPTADHDGLQEFMRAQITQSIDFDCDEKYCSEPTVRLTGQEWAASRRKKLEHDIVYHTKANAEEIERANSRTEWVRQLRQAL